MVRGTSLSCLCKEALGLDKAGRAASALLGTLLDDQCLLGFGPCPPLGVPVQTCLVTLLELLSLVLSALLGEILMSLKYNLLYTCLL